MDLANTIKDLQLLETLVLSGNKLAFNSSDDRRSTGIEAFCNALWQATNLIDLWYVERAPDTKRTMPS